jgi:hypothetical protein
MAVCSRSDCAHFLSPQSRSSPPSYQKLRRKSGRLRGIWSDEVNSLSPGHLNHLSFKLGKMLLDDIPHQLQINTPVLMCQEIASGRELWPGCLRMGGC